MALTVGLTGDWMESTGNKRAVRATIAFDDSYPTGGESLTAANLGLAKIEYIEIAPKAGYTFEYDYANSKVLAYVSAGFTPAGTVAAPTFTGSALAAHRHELFIATGASDTANTRVNAITGELSITDAAVTIAGIAAASGAAGGIVDVTGGTPAGTNSAPAFTGTAVAAGVLVEVGDTTDLATLTGVRVRAIGY